MKAQQDTPVPMVVLLRGDSRLGPIAQPLQRVAYITQRDIEAMWTELGIDLRSWSPDLSRMPQHFPYPLLYAIQNYVVFEHECHFDQVKSLLIEANRAKAQVRGEEAGRAINVIIEVGSRMAAEGRGISFRPHLWLSPETRVLP